MAATLYTARLIGPEILEAGVTNTLTCPVYRDGTTATPASGTISIWTPGNTKVVDAAAVTITSSVATYSLLSATISSESNSDGWRIEWALTIDGIVHTFRRDGSKVHRRLYPVVTDADLLRSHTDLQRRTPSSETSYQDYLDEAWARIEGRLVNTGKRPWLIMSPSALRDVHTYLTLSLIFRDFATGGEGSAEWSMMEKYETLFSTAWAELTFPEADADGGANDPSRRTPVSPSIWLCQSAGFGRGA